MQLRRNSFQKKVQTQFFIQKSNLQKLTTKLSFTTDPIAWATEEVLLGALCSEVLMKHSSRATAEVGLPPSTALPCPLMRFACGLRPPAPSLGSCGGLAGGGVP